MLETSAKAEKAKDILTEKKQIVDLHMSSVD